jgi:hypothetical protein
MERLIGAGVDFLDESRQGAQGVVDVFRAPEYGGHIGFKHYDDAACRVARRVLVRLSATEVVLREYLTGIGQIAFINCGARSLHILFAHGVLLAAR